MRMPVRLRVTLAFAGAMALLFSAFAVFLWTRLGTELLEGIDMNLRARGGAIVSSLEQRAAPPPLETAQTLIDPDEAFAQILDRTGRVIETTSGARGTKLLTPAEASAIRAPTFLDRRPPGLDDPARLLAAPAANDRVVVVGATLSDRAEALGRLAWLLALGGPLALTLASGAGWLVAGAALRPVDRLRREAAGISVTDLDRRVAVPTTGDEIARLAQTLNEMLDRLAESVEREHRFVDDASHELRTPLAVLKTELDLALSRPRSAQDLSEAIGRAAAETDRVVRLAEDLLVLARTRGGRLPLRPEPVRLVELLDEVASGFKGLVEVRTPDVTARFDRARVRQAVENLIENAVRHGAPPVVVEARRDDDTVTIAVSDCGPGLPRSIRRTAFEPFVRGPTADLDQGVGLGLAIVHAVAISHGGSASLEDAAGGGLRAAITLPA